MSPAVARSPRIAPVDDLLGSLVFEHAALSVSTEWLVNGGATAAPTDWLTLSISGLALVVSVTSVVVGVAIAMSDRRAKRREATLRAWLEWRDESLENRRVLAKAFSPQMTAAQARALRLNLPAEGLPEPGTEERLLLARAVPETLNGLERIALGIQMGLFDSQALATLGQLIILRHYERCREYVEFVRTTPGNADVYSGVTVLVSKLAAQDRT